ncbi:MAG: hypothetical protein LBE91_16890, partial [Tannerella sp.]|nr:hypothetical protein [Tannerella sp.]
HERRTHSVRNATYVWIAFLPGDTSLTGCERPERTNFHNRSVNDLRRCLHSVGMYRPVERWHGRRTHSVRNATYVWIAFLPGDASLTGCERPERTNLHNPQ